MTIASIGTAGSVGQAASITTGLTFGAAIPVGTFLVLLIAKDNANTTDVATTEVSSIVNTGSVNTWSRIGGYCNGQGSASAGAVIDVWGCFCNDLLQSGWGVSISFTSGTPDSAITMWQFTPTPGYIIVPSLTTPLATDGAAAASMLIAPPSIAPRLYVRAEACEDTVAAFTATTGWTKFTDQASGGTGMVVGGEWIIANAKNKTSTPTGTNAGKDRASVTFWLDEVPAPQALAFGLCF